MLVVFISTTALAQNVGIGTATPQVTLDVKGNQRLGGTTSFTTFDSLSGKIEWRNANLYVPVSQYLLQHSAAGDGLYYNNNAPISGQLEYRNAFGNPVFYTNFTNGNGYFKNNLGINNLTPQFPLSLNGALGDKISLWTDGTSTHYGMGIQSGLFQIFSKTSVDDIAFGYGNSNLFTETMRVKGNGNVGIGNNPFFKLDISGRMRIRSGNDGDAGIWLNNNANTALQSFIGSENDTYVGLYGAAGAGWGLSMNTATGALKVNGSEGVAGQVLQSNGAAAPTWANQTDPLVYKTQYYQTAITNVLLTNASNAVQIIVPVTVYANSIITVSVTVSVTTASFLGCTNGDLAITTEPLGGGGAITVAGRFTTICGVNGATVTTGELPLTVSGGAMKIFGPGTGIGAVVRFLKANTGPDLTIGSVLPARIIVKVVPQ